MKILQGIILIFIFIISLLIFFPKDIAFFKLEQILKKQNIIINEQFITPKLAGFTIKNSDVFIDSMNLIHFQKADLSMYIIYNKLDFTNLKIDTFLIPNLKIEYSILHPTKILIISSKTSANGFES